MRANMKTSGRILRFLVVFVMLLALLLVATVTGAAREREPKLFYMNHKFQLEEAVQEILRGRDVTQVEIEGVRSISYWDGENPIIEFTISAFGLVPSSTYKGVYYSVNGQPAPFQNADLLLTETQSGWSWRGTGDNGGTTERIEENWFSFEAHF